MSAHPAEAYDPHDPQVILHELPERERSLFLAEYQKAAQAAADDAANYTALQQVLDNWSNLSRILTKVLEQRPNYYEEIADSREAFRDGATKHVPIEEVFHGWDAQVAAARARRHG